MTELRPGEGGVTSQAAAKQSMGRGFIRPAKNHQGGRSDPTAWAVEKDLTRTPTKTEIEVVFGKSPSEVRAFRGSGMSDEQIYDILNKRN